MLIILCIVLAGILVLLLKPDNADLPYHDNKTNRFYSTSEYTSLRNIFEDCSHVNKDFPILSIEFKEEEVKGFYRIYIQFQELECYVISCQESGLETAEKQIRAEYQAEVDRQMKTADIQTAVKIAMDKAQRCRKEIQKEKDTHFYQCLFNEYKPTARNYAIPSPYEAYASSGGKYIVDHDYWKIDGENAAYTNILSVGSDNHQAALHAIEDLAHEFFPGKSVRRVSGGCYISGNICKV